MSEIQTISAQRLAELAELADECEIDLIDVRTPVEYREVHAEGARNYPLDSLDPNRFMNERVAASDQPIYLICKSGSRATMACKQFIKAGYANVVCVEGGTTAWDNAGLPVKRGKKAISLERQVRIVAGSLVLIGSLLAFFVHPYFVGLPAFIGAGLTFAGITDTCGMGMILAKMPWNRVGGASCSTN